METLKFLRPDLLWYLLVLIPLTGLLFYFEGLRQKRCRLLINSDSASIPKPNLLSYTPILVTTLILFSLARPYTGSEEIKVARGSGSDIVLVVDISRSMLAKDIKPSRLEFIKRKLQDLRKIASSKVRADKIGIVLFAGESYLFCPLTQDYGVLDYFIKSISPDLVSSQGSAILDAIQTAIKSLQEVKSEDARIILVSDGEDNQLNVDAVISLAQESKQRIDVLAIGTSEGAPIELSDRSFIKDRSGNIVISKLNEIPLKEIALATGGLFQTAQLSDNDLEALFPKETLTQDGSNSGQESSITVYKEVGTYLLVVALFLLLAFHLLRLRAFAFVLLLCVLNLPKELLAQVANPTPEAQENLSLYQAYRAYQDGDFARASETFAESHKSDPEDLEILQAYASSLYKLGRFQEAKSLFSELLNKSKSAKTKFEAKYNLGNSNFNLKDYKTAIANYEEALAIKLDDEKTKSNLELARKKLLEEKQNKPTPTPTPQASPTATSQESSSSTQGSSSSSDSQSSESQSSGSQSSEAKSEQEQKNGENSEEKDQENSDKSSDDGQESEKKTPVDDTTAASEEQNKTPQKTEPVDEKAIKESEARAWLESLSDAPILLRKKVGKSVNRNGQSW